MDEQTVLTPNAFTGSDAERINQALQAAAGTGPARSAADGTIHKTFNQVVTVRARATGSPSVSL